jgi:hypothetical protein
MLSGIQVRDGDESHTMVVIDLALDWETWGMYTEASGHDSAISGYPDTKSRILIWMSKLHRKLVEDRFYHESIHGLKVFLSSVERSLFNLACTIVIFRL